MAGGLFDNQPFSINIKCVVGTFMVACVYWMLPKNEHHIIISILVALVSSISIFLYNKTYDCQQFIESENEVKNKVENEVENILLSVCIGLISFALVQFILPRKNYWVLATALYLPYLVIAWWDYIFDCSNRMDPTIFPFGRYIYLPFKPSDYKMRWKTMSADKKDKIAQFDAWVFWILFAGVSTFSVGFLLPRVLNLKTIF